MHSLISSIRLAVALGYASTVLSQKYQNFTHSEKVTAAAASPKYKFDASSSQNVAVYFGRTDQTINTNLTAQCSDKNIDIVMLAFVTQIFGGGGYPNLGFEKLCTGQTSEMIAANATGLLSCTDLEPQIQSCQSAGKKVLVALGGQNGETTFANTTEAQNAATLLWNLFGGGSAEDAGLRPFGNVKVDGFDIDNELGDGSYYEDFAAALRSLFTAQKRKTYYLSAAPSCSLTTNGSNPLEMLNLMDFVWPQFYGAPSCNIGTDSFPDSVKAWSERLVGPKLYIGSPSFAGGTTNGGYEEPDAFAKTLKSARADTTEDFGGVMLWDGAYGHITMNSQGLDYIAVSKKALTS
ncbi:hypothetical protein ONS95_004470 [Cadophora gregata]|uniref:uncharacterized protein n=1 Tax=Cadophora gregata TaxID=51156 RepID=UPI0026DB7617|nr:uncharacterized protein ONS95_004470 [Cadophora gregata]KAK0105959.1 hypothetical protein ONS95_004470 [Cadophora gregata]